MPCLRASPLARVAASRRVADNSFGGEAPDQPAEPCLQACALVSAQRRQDARLPGLPRVQDASRDCPALWRQVEPDVPLIVLIAAAPDPALPLQPGGQPAHRALLQAQQAAELALGDPPGRDELDQRAGLRCRYGRETAVGRGLAAGPASVTGGAAACRADPWRTAFVGAGAAGLGGDAGDAGLGGDGGPGGNGGDGGDARPGGRAGQRRDRFSGRHRQRPAVNGPGARRPRLLRLARGLRGARRHRRTDYSQQLSQQPSELSIFQGVTHHTYSCTAQLSWWYSRDVIVAPYNSCALGPGSSRAGLGSRPAGLGPVARPGPGRACGPVAWRDAQGIIAEPAR